MAGNGKTVKLSDFLAKFAIAGAEAGEACVQEYERVLRSFFEERGGKLRPKTVTVQTGTGEVDVPLMSLIKLAPIDFQKMDLKFTGSVDVGPEGECSMANHQHLLKRAVEVEVHMEFKLTDPPEGYELVVERLNRELSAKLSPMQGPDAQEEKPTSRGHVPGPR